MSVNMKFGMSQGVLLTMADVEGWRKEAEEIAAEIAALRSRAEALDVRLKAAAFFMEDGAALVATPNEDSAPQPEGRVRSLPRPMTALVRELFEEGTRLTASQVLAKLSEDPDVAPHLEEKSNNVYTALGRLVNRDNLLMRDDNGVYMLASANEPPSGDTAGGSGAGEGSYPSLNLQPQAHSDG